MGENIESKPLGTRIAYAFGLAIGIGVKHVKKAYESLRYSVGFLGHLARNRHRYMLEFDKMTAEEENIRATVVALQKQNEALMKRHGTNIDRYGRDADGYRLEGKKAPNYNYDCEEVVKKSRLTPEEAREAADQLLQNQKFTSDAIDNNNQFLSSGSPVDRFAEPLPGSKDSLVAAAKKVMETSVKH